MDLSREGLWRGDDGVVLGRIYSVQREDLDRVQGLSEDSLIIPVQLRGECLYRYQLIARLKRSTFKLVTDKAVECYPIGVPYEKQPSEDEHHKLMSGESTGFSYTFDISDEYKAAIAETLKDMDMAVAYVEQIAKRRRWRTT